MHPAKNGGITAAGSIVLLKAMELLAQTEGDVQDRMSAINIVCTKPLGSDCTIPEVLIVGFSACVISITASTLAPLSWWSTG